jgi:dipeptidyl aminopeptidase/acylaminoacyl peptidase
VILSSFDLANNTVVYAKTEVANPSELYFANTDFKKQRKGSDFNGWVGNKNCLFLKTFTNDLGLEVEYWVMKPTNYKQGENIHYY